MTSALQVGVGSEVIFDQGKYIPTAGRNDGGVFYHLGIIERMSKDSDGKQLYHGRHLKGEADGKRPRKS
jgi:hypothetical protein